MRILRCSLRAALVLALALGTYGVSAQTLGAPAGGSTADASLDEQFRDPPNSARPRVWWHWMNGNVSKDGIASDLAWMQRIGIGGAQTFDANMQTPQVVDKRLVYMTPEWKDTFRFATVEADRLGLELAIASSPGWSETGGPWVKPEDGMKKLVWGETEVAGGRPFTGRLAAPPTVTGPFQSLAKTISAGEMGAGAATAPPPAFYGDVAVLAYPAAGQPIPVPAVADGAGHPLAAAALWDSDLATAVELGAGTGGNEGRTLTLTFAHPRTIRSASLFTRGTTLPLLGALFAPRIEAQVGGADWRPVAELPLGDVPVTVGFAAVTARAFRIVLTPRRDALDQLSKRYGPAIAKRFTAGGDPFSRPVQIADFRLSEDDRVDRAETKAGFMLAPDYFTLSQGVPDVPGVAPAKVIDLTGKLRADGTLDWTPPKGTWKVLRLGWSLLGTTNHPASPEATGLEVDKLDGAAVRRYMEHYLGMYRDTTGGLIGERGVRALLTDSTEVGPFNWTPRMVEQFKRLRGYDPTPWLPALTGTIVGSRRQSDDFLYDFRRTLADLHASEHYGTVAAVAHEHGLKVYGEALEDQRPVIGDDMAMRRHTDIPMAAMWTYPRGGAPRTTLLADIKGAASVAHVYGQNLVAAESLTAAGPAWGWTPAELKRIIDLEFALGVNRPVIHTSVHAPVDDKLPGLSLGGIGQYFNRHETWAEMAKPWIDYIARNSLMLQQGRNVADVAYFYGEEAPITGLYGQKPVADAPKHYGYDFVNADVLTDALSNDGADLVTPGGARYRALYLGGSSRRMTLPTLRRIAQLVQGGATVIGSRPEANPSLAGDAGEWNALADKLWPASADKPVIDTSDIEAALRSIGVKPDFRFDRGQPDSDILFLHRQLSDGDSWFLSNRKDRSETIEARFRVAGKAPELWHADTGASEPVSYRIEGGETIVPLTLAPEESVHVVFRKPAPAGALAIKKLAPVELATVAGRWTVAFQPGRGAPASTTLATLAPLNEQADPGIKYFSGVATYVIDFTTPRGWKAGQRLWLDLGQVGDLAEVRVNGKPAGIAWHAPYQLDIAEVAKAGRNSLEVRVANLWVNRLIGDAQPGIKPITWIGLKPYNADDRLRPSGLIGPVRLMGESDRGK